MRKVGLWKDYGLVFPGAVGTSLSHRNVVRAFKELLRRAGFPGTTRLYDLRHTCATLMLSRNGYAKYIQEPLGHASIALTLDTYPHVLKGMDGGIGGAVDEARVDAFLVSGAAEPLYTDGAPWPRRPSGETTSEAAG